MDDRSATDDGYLTVRIPRRVVRRALAAVVALLVHGAIVGVAALLPAPKPVEQRVQISIAPARPPPPAPESTPPPRVARKVSRPPTATPRTTSPVLPELPPSEQPPPERAQLPIAERSDEPAPPPAPTSWRDRLFAQLAATSPRPTHYATGELAPTRDTLERVAMSDARMHDEETEARLAQDFGPFFQRGLDQLRANWHPQEVLDRNERDPTRACGRREARTSYAVAILDREGNVTDAELKNPSGCDDLDKEAVEAFKRVARFPFPPWGLFVDPDGTERDTARFPVRFIVTFDGGLRLLWD